MFLTLHIIMYRDLGENISGGGKKGRRQKKTCDSEKDSYLSQDSHTNIQEQDLSLKSSAWKSFTQLHELDNVKTAPLCNYKC